MDNREIIVGIDAGTSVVKAVAFDLEGTQLGTGAVRNHYQSGPEGSAQQDMARTWRDCVKAIRLLALEVANLSQRVVAIAVTGQGDGTWLVDKANQPVGDAWIWLDGRAAPTVQRLNAGPAARARFEATGTGLNTCQQGAQMAHMDRHFPELLGQAEAALHCKDWLYLNLTGVRATDPSEASFTFGNFRNRQYDDQVIEALGLTSHRRLLPEIVEGTEITHPLSAEAAQATGLREGTPVCLGYVDMVMTALGAGVHTGEENTGCSIVGSTGVHMRAVTADRVWLNQEQTGYVIALPIPNVVTQVQTNMAATLNLDWALNLAASLINDFGGQVDHGMLVKQIDRWLASAPPDSLLFHPYISEAGERGPFVNANARASFIGLKPQHGFADLLRSVIEGIGLAARDCYQAMGEIPREIRLSGGAGRSAQLRQIFSAAVGAPVRINAREEAGAAGAAMMAAVAIGAYPDMESCVKTWVTPLLGASEQPEPTDLARFTALYDSYRQARDVLPPVWSGLHDVRKRFEN